MAKNRLRYGDDLVLKNNQVGIGTSTPTVKLDIIGDVKISGNLGVAKTITNPVFTGIVTLVGLTTSNTSAGFARTNQVEFKSYSRDNVTLVINGYGNQILTLNDNFDSDAFVISNYKAKPYSYIQGGLFTPTDFIEQALRIDSSGNTIVGMGTSINAKLDVRGGVVLGSPYIGSGYVGPSTHTINGDVTLFGQFRPRAPFSNTNYVAVGPNTSDTGTLNFYVGTSSTTTIPNNLLSISNNNSGSLFRINETTVGFASTTNLTNPIINPIFEVNANNNVGVGTTIPTAKFHVQGNSYFSGITTVGIGTSTLPTINSTMSFELTNNTTLTFRVKGTDGTIRSGTITLS